MARTKNRNDDPLPSSPMRPPTHNLWLKYGPNLDRLQIHSWCTDWATYECLKIAINGREYQLVDESLGWYETDDGELRFRVIEPQGNDLISKKPEREDWSPGEPALTQLKMAAGIVTESNAHKPVVNEVRESNKRKTRVKSVPKDGLISIGEICEELKINPRDARKILRNRVEKPDAGWAWPPSEVPSIKKLLK